MKKKRKGTNWMVLAQLVAAGQKRVARLALSIVRLNNGRLPPASVWADVGLWIALRLRFSCLLASQRSSPSWLPRVACCWAIVAGPAEDETTDEVRKKKPATNKSSPASVRCWRAPSLRSLCFSLFLQVHLTGHHYRHRQSRSRSRTQL